MCGVYFGNDDNVLELGSSAQFCESVKNTGLCTSKRVSVMVYELHLNENKSTGIYNIIEGGHTQKGKRVGDSGKSCLGRRNSMGEGLA